MWAGHSLAHILQLTHRSATSRTAGEDSCRASGSCWNRKRIRLALARGVAASAWVTRKIGHIRWAGASVRQWPQPLQLHPWLAISWGDRVTRFGDKGTG